MKLGSNIPSGFLNPPRIKQYIWWKFSRISKRWFLWSSCVPGARLKKIYHYLIRYSFLGDLTFFISLLKISLWAAIFARLSLTKCLLLLSFLVCWPVCLSVCGFDGWKAASRACGQVLYSSRNLLNSSNEGRFASRGHWRLLGDIFGYHNSGWYSCHHLVGGGQDSLLTENDPPQVFIVPGPTAQFWCTPISCYLKIPAQLPDGRKG